MNWKWLVTGRKIMSILDFDSWENEFYAIDILQFDISTDEFFISTLNLNMLRISSYKCENEREIKKNTHRLRFKLLLVLGLF